MKQEKGITIVSLVIIIILLIILTGVGIGIASPIIGKAKAEDITTELMLIQAKWKVEREKVSFDGESGFPSEIIITDEENGDKGKLSGATTDDVPDSAKIENANAYYKLSQEALDSMGLGKLNAETGYVVTYESDDIIYLPGVKDDEGNTFYKLSEIKDL